MRCIVLHLIFTTIGVCFLDTETKLAPRVSKCPTFRYFRLPFFYVYYLIVQLHRELHIYNNKTIFISIFRDKTFFKISTYIYNSRCLLLGYSNSTHTKSFGKSHILILKKKKKKSIYFSFIIILFHRELHIHNNNTLRCFGAMSSFRISKITIQTRLWQHGSLNNTWDD